MTQINAEKLIEELEKLSLNYLERAKGAISKEFKITQKCMFYNMKYLKKAIKNSLEPDHIADTDKMVEPVENTDKMNGWCSDIKKAPRAKWILIKFKDQHNFDEMIIIVKWWGSYWKAYDMQFYDWEIAYWHEIPEFK